MFSIVKSTKIHRDAVVGYSGILSCILYGEWDEKISSIVNDIGKWNSMHDFSGPELLIIVPRAAKAQQKQYQPQSSRVMEDRHKVGFMIGIEPADLVRPSAISRELSDWFGVPFDKLPCMFIFADPMQSDGYCLTFQDGNEIEQMKVLFSVCKEAVQSSNLFRTAATSSSLVEARREAINRIVPQITKSNIFRAVKNIALKDKIGLAAGLVP